MNVILVAAIGANGLIGIGDKLPWNSPEEMRIFKQITENGIVIVGRKTYSAIGSLRNRFSVVITRSQKTNNKFPYWNENQSPTASMILNPGDLLDCQFVTKEEREFAYNEQTFAFIKQLAERYKRSTVYVIGGAEIYRMFLPYYTGVAVSFMKASAPDSPECVYMPSEVLNYITSTGANPISRLNDKNNGYVVYQSDDHMCFPKFTHVRTSKV